MCMSVEAADAKKAEGASIQALIIPRHPSLTGSEAWSHWSSPRSTFRISVRPFYRIVSNWSRSRWKWSFQSVRKDPQEHVQMTDNVIETGVELWWLIADTTRTNKTSYLLVREFVGLRHLSLFNVFDVLSVVTGRCDAQRAWAQWS